MKKLLLLTKTLLAAVLLCVGQNAWAAVEITETYDFKTFTQSSQPSITKTGDAITQTGESEKKGSVYLITSPTGLDLKNRFALDITENSYQIRFMWRTHGSYTYQQGLSAGWNGNASTKNTEIHLSVLDLKAGDKITFTYSTKNNTDEQKPRTCKNGFLTGVANDVALTSGTEYTVATDGNLDLYLSNNNFAINTVVIKTTGTETVSEPSFAITGAYNKTRKVTITAGTSDAGNDVTTFYTTDGSTPTTSSASFTTASQEITVGESAESESTVTVKAYSVSSASAESTVSSQNVTVGTLVQLAAPSINLSSFTAAGLAYNPTYTFTSDQSAVLGTPDVTYTYSFAGGASTEGTSYTATESGSITVTVSADGYTSNSTVQSIVGGNYAKTYAFDAINDVTVDTKSGTWDSQTNVGGVQWTFTDLTNCTYTLRADISLTNFRYARATTAQSKQGFYVRAGNGSVGFTLTDGEYIVFGMYGGTNTIVNSGTSKSFGQYSNVRSIEIFTPATDIDIAILDCKKYDTSAAFATAIDAESFASVEAVYAFNTTYHVTNGVVTDGVRDVTGVIRNAAVNDAAATDWAGATTYYKEGEQYTGAPDHYVLDRYGNQMWATQTIYGLPAGVYVVNSATRGAVGSYSHVYVSNGTEDLVQIVTNAVGDGAETGTLGNGWTRQEGTFTITEPTNIILGFYADGRENKWCSCDDWHLYRIESVPATIGSTGWTTFASPYALDLSSMTASEGEVTAYYASETSAESVTVLPTSSSAVQAGEGILLKGTAGATITIPVVASGSAIDGNLMVGCPTGATITNETANYDKCYVLGIESVQAVFQNVGDYIVGGNTVNIPAGKAYLNANASYGARSISIVFADDVTGVANVEAASEAKAKEGKFIENGKLVIVKNGQKFNAAGAKLY